MRHVLALGCALLMTAALAAPARADAPGWSVVPSLNPTGPAGGFGAVSCPTATSCIAIGGYLRATGEDVLLAERREAGAWRREAIPTPRGSRLTNLYDVSCPSASSCMAVGSSLTSSDRFVTLAERWNGVRWSIVRTPNPAGAAGSILNGVSCLSARSCIAVGELTDAGGFFESGTVAERWDGATWSVLPTPLTERSFLGRVSCSSPAACTATGGTVVDGSERTLAERWDGASWAVVPTPDVQGGVLRRIACASASACMVTGFSSGDAGAVHTLAERWDGRAWSVVPTVDRAGPGDNHLWAVACAAASACAAVGNGADEQPLAEAWDGSRWSLEPSVSPIGAQSAHFNAISCLSPVACTAVGERDDAAGNPIGSLAERWDGATWTLQATPDASGAALAGVACPTAWTCLAVGAVTNASGVTRTYAERWDGTRWSVTPTPDPAGAPGARLTGIACSSASSCMASGLAMDVSGAPVGTLVEQWDGTRWTILPTPNPPGRPGAQLSGISCPATSWCMATGNTFDTVAESPSGVIAERWDGRDWQLVPIPDPPGAPRSELLAVSCASASACMTVGDASEPDGTPAGNLTEHWDGRQWSVVATPPTAGGDDSILSGVSCSSATRCSATGLTFPGFPPQTVAQRWDGSAWTLQPTPALPFTGEFDQPAVACPTAWACFSAGGFNDSGLMQTLVERWPAQPPSVSAASSQAASSDSRSAATAASSVADPAMASWRAVWRPPTRSSARGRPPCGGRNG